MCMYKHTISIFTSQQSALLGHFFIQVGKKSLVTQSVYKRDMRIVACCLIKGIMAIHDVMLCISK